MGRPADRARLPNAWPAGAMPLPSFGRRCLLHAERGGRVFENDYTRGEQLLLLGLGLAVALVTVLLTVNWRHLPLKRCPDCGGRVSRSATVCRHCGCPLAARHDGSAVDQL